MRSAEILLYDVIGVDFFGEGVSAKQFAEDLKTLALTESDELILRVNSPGGSVWDGLAIYNSLLRYPAKVIARVEGVAASAASFIIQAANEIEVAEASSLMIHGAWSFTIGDAKDHAKAAERLSKDDETLANIYAKRSGLKAEDFAVLMAEETWFTGPEAVKAGLADRLTPDVTEQSVPEAAAARAQKILARFRHTPAALLTPSGNGQAAADMKRAATAIEDAARQLQKAADDRATTEQEQETAALIGRMQLTTMQATAALAADALAEQENTCQT